MTSAIEELRNLNLEQESLKARKDAIKSALAEHRDSLTDEEIINKTKEAEEIRTEMSNLETKIADAQSRATIEEENKNKNLGENLKMENNEDLLQRANSFKTEKRATISNEEVRSILLSTGGIAKPTKVGGINDMLSTANSAIDMVEVVDSTGCGQYDISFQKTLQTAAKGTDGTAISATDPTFGKVAIKPYLVKTLTYVSRELQKQTPLNYYEKVKAGALKALRVKINNLIYNGDSTDFYGIYNSVDTDSNSMVDTYATTATNGTKFAATAGFLRSLVLSYGGDENAFGSGVLFLNKKDLIALGDVRGTNEKKALYDIIPDASNPNTGIIKEGGFSVRYSISSNLNSLFDTAAATGTTLKTMIYGIPTNYNLSLFGDYSIEESRDYKFAEGLISILGEVMVGGNVQVWKGFTVVTLATA